MNNILQIVSILSLISGFLCASVILFSIFPYRRQPMKIMEAVWPLTGLWAGWIGLWAYFRIGIYRNTLPKMDMKKRVSPQDGLSESSRMAEMKMEKTEMNMPSHSRWQTVALSTLHCGAGCTLADIIGEWFTFFVPLSIGGSFIAGQWTLDYLLALIIGVFFQ